jgi:nucleotide-binding universal stress UspA family protein
MIRTVMVPLDGSPFAEQALPYATAVARRAGAALDLMRVHVVYAMQPPSNSRQPYSPEVERESRVLELAYLNEAAGRVREKSGVRVTTGLAGGLTADGILARGREVSADLVVMTTHGAGPLSRAFLGSTSDELVRRSPIPLLLVRPQVVSPDLGREPVINKVLVPVDGSSRAEQILKPAMALGRLMGAALTLLYVEAPSGGHDRGIVEARPYLENLADHLRVPSCEVRVRVVADARIARAILSVAREGDHDLIALATHGRGGLKRLLLGSVADKVLRSARCPLLVLNPTGPDNGV